MTEPTMNELKKIIQQELGWTDNFGKHGLMIPQDYADRLTQAIQDLLAEQVRLGRIDEWERMAREYPTAPYIPDFIWKERLAQLKDGGVNAKNN